jgi:hypothetical protein
MYISCLESFESSVVVFQMEFHRVSRLFSPHGGKCCRGAG